MESMKDVNGEIGDFIEPEHPKEPRIEVSTRKCIYCGATITYETTQCYFCHKASYPAGDPITGTIESLLRLIDSFRTYSNPLASVAVGSIAGGLISFSVFGYGFSINDAALICSGSLAIGIASGIISFICFEVMWNLNVGTDDPDRISRRSYFSGLIALISSAIANYGLVILFRIPSSS